MRESVERWTRCRRRQRGVAYAEAAILTMFFFLIWCSLVYVTQLDVARQGARLSARECAWAIAIAGCRDVPPRCDGSAVKQLPSDPKLEQEFVPIEEEVKPHSQTDEHGVVSGASDAVGAEIEGLLFQRTTAQGTREVEQPIRYGGRTVRVGASYSLPCNSVPRSVSDQAERLFRGIL